jgi:DNA modification methylase
MWANDGKFGGESGGKHAYHNDENRKRIGREKRVSGLKPKDLCMAPHRLAIALQDAGWWVRSSNVWAKPNGMPESTKDRPTAAHEYVFQLTKSETYYYGYEDVKLPTVPVSVGRLERAMRANLDGGAFVISGGGYAPPGQTPHQGARRTDKQRGHGHGPGNRRYAGFNDRWDAKESAGDAADTAALRSVWWLPTASFPEAHFAVMPDELAALCVLAGCPVGGTVLDPFGGSGTVGLVADRLQRNAILIDLDPANAPMSEGRIMREAPLFAELSRAIETLNAMPVPARTAEELRMLAELNRKETAA